jgi:tripartite-type tricarboxylate transporter receptor subunit TctC
MGVAVAGKFFQPTSASGHSGQCSRKPQVMLTNPSFAAKTIPEIIDYANANPGQVKFSSPGIGSISHLAGELFKNRGFFRISSLIDRVHPEW